MKDFGGAWELAYSYWFITNVDNTARCIQLLKDINKAFIQTKHQKVWEEAIFPGLLVSALNLKGPAAVTALLQMCKACHPLPSCLTLCSPVWILWPHSNLRALLFYCHSFIFISQSKHTPFLSHPVLFLPLTLSSIPRSEDVPLCQWGGAGGERRNESGSQEAMHLKSPLCHNKTEIDLLLASSPIRFSSEQMQTDGWTDGWMDEHTRTYTHSVSPTERKLCLFASWTKYPGNKAAGAPTQRFTSLHQSPNPAVLLQHQSTKTLFDTNEDSWLIKKCVASPKIVFFNTNLLLHIPPPHTPTPHTQQNNPHTNCICVYFTTMLL